MPVLNAHLDGLLLNALLQTVYLAACIALAAFLAMGFEIVTKLFAYASTMLGAVYVFLIPFVSFFWTIGRIIFNGVFSLTFGIGTTCWFWYSVGLYRLRRKHMLGPCSSDELESQAANRAAQATLQEQIQQVLSQNAVGF